MHSIEEQQASGRAARKTLPRSAHAEWTASRDREVMAIVADTERDRIPELLAIRRQRMAASPFGFFRGAAAVMARDLAARPNTGLTAQICGDAHVLNLGAYSSPEGHLVFDINDFDETVRAPFEWDLLRFATSLVLAGREAGGSGRRCVAAVTELVRSYRKGIGKFSLLPYVALLRHDIKRIVRANPVDLILRKAERATPDTLLKKLTEGDVGQRLFRHAPPLLRRVTGAEEERVLASLAEYQETLRFEGRLAARRYRPAGIAFKVVGTGSIGLHNYVVLFTGVADDDVAFLQVKETSPSCYAPYVEQPAGHNGRRVAEGARLMQRASDPFLGWTTIEGRDYLVRQLNDHKASIEPRDLKGGSLVAYAAVAGAVLARAHARTGEAAAIAAYCGAGDKLDCSIAQFAVAYADQSGADHAVLRDAGSGV